MWDSLDLRLPSCWNDKDKARNIKVDLNGLDLIYIGNFNKSLDLKCTHLALGPGAQENDAASVRANFPIRSRCGVYYYELKVISRGRDGFIGIGFCGLNNRLDRLPGWDTYSWGYHGDDGHSFAGSGIGTVYGPFFTTGDVVGCGINFADQSVFYTKNGTMIGTAFHSLCLPQDVYPCVGLRTKGEMVTTNFGENAFAFDIVQYVKASLRSHSTPALTQTDTPPSSSLLNHLVLSHLAHNGYGKTVKALLQNVSYTHSDPITFDWDEKEVLERQAIRDAVMTGDIDLAIDLLDTKFPGLFANNERGQTAMFQLKCQKFIEMLRNLCSGSSEGESDGKYWPRNDPITSPTTRTKSLPVNAPGRRLSYAAITASSPTAPTLSRSTHHISPSLPFPAGQANIEMLKQIMEYGQKLYEEYRSDERSSVQMRLKEIFSLLAYPDPTSSQVGYLFDNGGRNILATELNAAILVCQKRPGISSLEHAYRQALVTSKELAIHGDSKAVMITVEETMCQPSFSIP
ncbi:concanavalin A-like lectin/glucanase domain-containing protein [Phycomyces nitens]|nr:concanavalin A-like lectin/glucanase domain-containing protein [Phycomyces nitens]